MNIPPVASGNNPLSGTNASDPNDPEQFFINFFKESTGDQMADLWLMSHHLTRQELQKMPEKQREAIERQMEADIKREVEEKLRQKMAEAGNISLG